MTEEESRDYKKYYCPSCLLEDPKRKNLKYENNLLEKTSETENTENPENTQIPENPPQPGKTSNPAVVNKTPETSTKHPVKPHEPPQNTHPTPKDETMIIETYSKSNATICLDKTTQANSETEFKDTIVTGLVSDFSRELTKVIQENTKLKSMIHDLETEVTQHKIDQNRQKQLEGDIVMLISSNKEKDAHILDLERKLEETVDALQLTKDQLDVATIDLNDNIPNSRLTKQQAIIDTKEKHLREKTTLLNKYRDALEKSRKENDQRKKEVDHLSKNNINNKLLHVAIAENCDLIKELDIERNKVLQLHDQRKTDSTKIKELTEINQRLKQKKDNDDDYETITDDSSADEIDPAKETRNPSKVGDKHPPNKTPSSPKNKDRPQPLNDHPHFNKYSRTPPSVCRFFLENRCRYGTSCWRDHPMDQKRPNLQSYNQNRQRYSNQPPNYNQHRPTTRNSYQHPGNHSPENRESRSTSVSTGNYSSIPKNREPHQFNQQPQPQSLNPQNLP